MNSEATIWMTVVASLVVNECVVSERWEDGGNQEAEAVYEHGQGGCAEQWVETGATAREQEKPQ